MARVFQNDLNTNLTPDFFEYPHQIEPKLSTIQSEVRDQRCKIGKFVETPMYKDPTRKNYASKALAGIQEVSPFSYLFFSSENIEEVQRLIRYNVYLHTDKKHIIGKQDETELLIIMRAVYLQYGRVPESQRDYKASLEKLNRDVVTQLLPDLVSNVKQYVGYIRDSTQNHIPLDRGTNPSIKGERTLRSVSDVLIGDDLFFKSN